MSAMPISSAITPAPGCCEARAMAKCEKATAAEIADRLHAIGGDTASLSPAECELLMRALRTWDEMLAALCELVDACAYVSPIAGAVATEASVKQIRQAGRIMKAISTARAAIAKAEAVA
jgi:hypothetical protein